ncbi:MAG: ribonuclease D, partial [Anaerohalosphaera sp.]|nr:ribonuclease D [Anaerohalosphaera sp.]
MNTLHKPYKYIDTDKALADLNELMLTTGRIAIDIEADSLHHYYEKVCLIQFTIKNKNFIVDPLAKLDLTSFLNILASKPLILHDAGYDLRMLRSSFGFITESDIFDTMLAAQLLGYERLGLVALIQELCDISLSKQDQKSNWSKRPLTLDQLQYASDDTFYLHELADILRGKLKKLNRLHWHEQACKKMISSAAMEKPPVDPDTVWRIKGSSHLDHFQLTILRAVWHWRDQQA